MPKVLFSMLFILIAAVNCSQRDYDTKSERVDGKRLQLLIKNAIRGNDKSNFKLSGFLMSYTPPGENYNQLVIDSTVTSSGVKLYSVLLEFPNPLFNILAVYDENLNLYLQDNSLNGNIAATWETISDKQYLVTSENFISKDKIELSRLSLYSIDESNLSAVFRNFTRLKYSGKNFKQVINYVSNDKITTRITSNNSKKLKNKTVIFNYNNSTQKYVSENDIFYNFVLEEVRNANWAIEKPELSIETVVQIKADLKRANQDGNENPIEGTSGFQILLDPDWNSAVSISVTEHLSKTLEGILYINNKLGAQITIIKLPEGSNASQFVKYQFGQPTEGSYRVRSSELITSGNSRVQIYEHSCSNKSFLLILQVPKYTYEDNKNIYSDVVANFTIEC